MAFIFVGCSGEKALLLVFCFPFQPSPPPLSPDPSLVSQVDYKMLGVTLGVGKEPLWGLAFPNLLPSLSLALAPCEVPEGTGAISGH